MYQSYKLYTQYLDTRLLDRKAALGRARSSTAHTTRTNQLTFHAAAEFFFSAVVFEASPNRPSCTENATSHHLTPSRPAKPIVTPHNPCRASRDRRWLEKAAPPRR